MFISCDLIFAVIRDLANFYLKIFNFLLQRLNFSFTLLNNFLCLLNIRGELASYSLEQTGHLVWQLICPLRKVRQKKVSFFVKIPLKMRMLENVEVRNKLICWVPLLVLVKSLEHQKL